MIHFYNTNNHIKTGFHISDTIDREIALNNLSEKLNFTNYFYGNQVHSGFILNTENNSSFEKGDGLLTYKKEILLGIFTADCVPITIYSNSFVGLIHAGWRGFVNNIFENFFKLINEKRKKDLKAIIGPCICENCYEVGEEVAKNFNFIQKKNNVKFNLNLKKEAFFKLKSFGLTDNNIEISNLCTFCSNKNLPSYRRNKTQLRIVNFIGMK